TDSSHSARGWLMARDRRGFSCLIDVPLLAVLLASLRCPSVRPAQSRTTSSQRSAPLASVDTALFRTLRYRMIGPNRGGRVTAVTGVPSQPHTFYMGVASGGVWKTTD